MTDLRLQGLSNQLIDAHCHLDMPDFESDLDEVLKRAENAGFCAFIIPGIEQSCMSRIIKIAGENPAVFFASGIHPNNAADLPEDWEAQLIENARLDKCAAIGEIGLDFYRDYCPADIQIHVFQRQLELAETLQLPVIIHCRNAFDTLWPMLMKWKEDNPDNQAVLHAFDEDAEIARKVVLQNFYLGIGGTYTYSKKNERREEILRAVSLESLILETDCPYLSPIPHRGERNEPAYAKLSAEKIAAVKGLPFEEAAGQLTQNALRLFPILRSVISIGEEK